MHRHNQAFNFSITNPLKVDAASHTIVGWGNNSFGQLNIPPVLGYVNAIAVSEVDSVVLMDYAPIGMELSDPTYTGQTFSARATPTRGRSLRLEFKDAWEQPNWQMRVPVPGNGRVVTLMDRNAATHQRFYRVRVR